MEDDTDKEGEPVLVKVPLGERVGDPDVDVVPVLERVKGFEEAMAVVLTVAHPEGEVERDAVEEVDCVSDLLTVPEPHWLTEAVELTQVEGLVLLLNVATMLVAMGDDVVVMVRDTVIEGEGLDVRVLGFEEGTAEMVALVHPVTE